MTTSDNLPDWGAVKKTFQTLWGYEDFRPPQAEVIQTLLAQKDALVVMPTGSGKSLCFQLPALLNRGITLVVSPLIALMEDQIQELKTKNISAGLLHHEISGQKRQATLAAISRQTLRILYLSPEALFSPPVWQRLMQPSVKINGLILDEAHCLVHWGDSFRPSYRRLGKARKSLLASQPASSYIGIAAFTATAAPKVQKILTEVLELNSPAKFLVSPYRDNLNLKVKIAWSPRCRRHLLQGFIASKNRQSGLVYVRSRRDGDNLALWLRSLGHATQSYHAGLTSPQRREREKQWLTGKLEFLVCTSAFGMGINKADLRWILHWQPPQLLSEYVQEMGRAGRDGQPAEALILRSEPTGWFDGSDSLLAKYFQMQRKKQYQQAWQLMEKIPPRGTVAEISQQYGQGELCLALLHSMGRLEWLDPFSYQIVEGKMEPTPPQFSAGMGDYLNTRQCRWGFLLQAFGFGSGNFRCGHCDNCQ